MNPSTPYRNSLVQTMWKNGWPTTLAILSSFWLESADAASLITVPWCRPQAVFGGPEVELKVVFHNSTAAKGQANVRARIYQTSKSIVAPVNDFDWRSIEVLAGQTIVETAVLRFPTVATETRFVVRWVDGNNSLIGVSDVNVYPTNLLLQLRSLGGNYPIGVFDPADQLKPLLRNAGVTYEEILEDRPDQFEGTLAIYCPLSGEIRTHEPVDAIVRHLTKRGKAVVWLVPSIEGEPLRPSFEVLRFNKGIVVVAQTNLMMNLSQSPEEQKILVCLAEYAIYPGRLVSAIYQPKGHPIP